MTFEYTDATGERVYFRPAVVNAHQPTQAVAMETETGRPVYFAVDQLEDVIAGMRDVRRQAAGQPAAAAPLAPCETTRHCATHGFCHRCAPESSKAAQYLVKAISAAEVDDARAGAVYARLAAELFAPECPQCDDTGACNGGPCAHPAAGQPDTQQQTETHLWEVDHPYYCTEGNYFAVGQHTHYDSWIDFQEEWGDLDDDYNLVFRWDWQRPDPADYEPYGEDVPPDALQVFWVLQRKAILRSTECTVTEADEPAVRAWLARKAAHLRRVWEPFLDEQPAA